MYAYLIKELYRHIPKYIIDRGYEYYEDGHVEDVEIHNNKVFAFVTGNAEGIMKWSSISKIFQKVIVNVHMKIIVSIWRQLFMICKMLVRVR